MSKKTIRWAAILFVLVAVAYYAAQGGFQTLKPPPIPAGIQTPAPPPAPAASEQAAETTDAGSQPRTGKMELAVPAKTSTPSANEPGEVTFSLRRQNPERTILPGVTIDSDKAVNIKLASDNERIQLKRGTTSDYQVMWQKKY